jgi:hypothetical protein
VAVIASLADGAALAAAFEGADAVLTALGVTATSQDPTALLSANAGTVEQAMLAAGVGRIVIVNTMLTGKPGDPVSGPLRLFRWMPGRIGAGARELQAVVDALGQGALSQVRWTLVRAGLNAKGKDEPPVASADWAGAQNGWSPVSYNAMGRWMLQEAADNAFVHAAPLVSRRKG